MDTPVISISAKLFTIFPSLKRTQKIMRTHLSPTGDRCKFSERSVYFSCMFCELFCYSFTSSENPICGSVKMEIKINYIGIIALIGAMLAVLAMFLNWITSDFLDMGLTGWELYKGDEFGQYLSSIFVLAFGVVAVVLAALEFLSLGNRIIRITIFFLGVLILMFSFSTYGIFIEDMGLFRKLFSMGYGILLEFVAGVTLMAASVISRKQSKG